MCNDMRREATQCVPHLTLRLENGSIKLNTYVHRSCHFLKIGMITTHCYHSD
jgi:hypothetical protein